MGGTRPGASASLSSSATSAVIIINALPISAQAMRCMGPVLSYSDPGQASGWSLEHPGLGAKGPVVGRFCGTRGPAGMRNPDAQPLGIQPRRRPGGSQSAASGGPKPAPGPIAPPRWMREAAVTDRLRRSPNPMRLLLAALSLSAGLASAAMAQTVTVGAAGNGQPPLRCGVDGTFAPHAFPTMGGGVQGFQIDL